MNVKRFSLVCVTDNNSKLNSKHHLVKLLFTTLEMELVWQEQCIVAKKWAYGNIIISKNNLFEMRLQEWRLKYLGTGTWGGQRRGRSTEGEVNGGGG